MMNMMKVIEDILFRSFGSGSNEFFLSNSFEDCKVNSGIYSLIPNFFKFVIEILIIFREFKIGFKISVRENTRNEVILINIGNF